MSPNSSRTSSLAADGSRREVGRTSERDRPGAIAAYGTPTAIGKTTAHSDTNHGRFVKLVPNEQVVEVDECETADPALRGEMTMIITLSDLAGGGTRLDAIHDGLTPGVSPSDNKLGWRETLDRFAALVEAGSRNAEKA